MAVIPSGCLHGGVLLTERSELDEARMTRLVTTTVTTSA